MGNSDNSKPQNAPMKKSGRTVIRVRPVVSVYLIITQSALPSMGVHIIMIAMITSLNFVNEARLLCEQEILTTNNIIM